MPRPYRTLGYPLVPIVFVLGIACLVISTLLKSPRESLLGLALVSLGLPFYFYWKRRRPALIPLAVQPTDQSVRYHKLSVRFPEQNA